MSNSNDSEYNPDYEGFNKLIKECSDKFLKIPSSKPIRVIGHLDADGICASAIMISALVKLNRKYTMTTLPAITEESLKPIREENEDYMIFVDLGSGSIDTVGKILDNKELFILDHHHLQSEINYPNVTQVNPHICGIDGSNEISGAGVTFMFTEALTNNRNTEMSRIALVGAIGDIQERDGFKRLNNEILKTAIANKYIDVRKGLKFFGVQTKPIYKLLQYSSDILIPGVNGSESGSINFLIKLGIDPKTKNGWKKISDLTSEEQQKLVAGIIMNRTNKAGSDPSDVFTNTYILLTEEEDTPFRDAKEFATLLNSCGRLNKSSIGIGACLNDKKMKEMALQNLTDYRKELVNALNWYRDNSSSPKVIKKTHYIIINAGEEVMPTMIGTLGSILSKSPDINENTFLLSLARNHDDTTKISLRIVGNPENVNLKEVLDQIIVKIEHGTSGGHSFAAGAVIDTVKEDAFVQAAEEVLSLVVFAEELVVQ